MCKILFVSYFILLCAIGYWCISDYIQERCQLTYANDKYIKDVVVFTGKRNRRDPYKTNMTGTLLMPYGNNVTFALILRMKTGGDFRIESKACETVKYKWMTDYVRQFTNLTLENCPFPAGTYRFMNMELPPKNVPLPKINADFYSIMELYITSTKEKILIATTFMRYSPATNKKNIITISS